MLVEMHMLKDYKTRVTGNYEVMRATLEVINRDADQLIRINQAADAATIEAAKNGGRVPLVVTASGETKPFQLEGFKWRIADSEISGTKRIEYSKEPQTITVPIQTTLKVVQQVTMPAAYIIPAGWTRIVDVLAAHELQMQKTKAPFTVEAGVYRCEAPIWQVKPFEGRHTASFYGVPMEDAGVSAPRQESHACILEMQKVNYPAGSVVIPMAQRAARIAVHFLEPLGPDSAAVWGFTDSIFEQKEYGESYVLEKLAPEMLAKDPKLKQEFEQKLATDKEFAANPSARLNFFFLHSPYRDERMGLYPIGRLKSVEAIPFE
jgi:hypothetical protein